MRKRVPRSSRDSTSSRPPIARISSRASNAPMPKPPGFDEWNGLNSRVRMNSGSCRCPNRRSRRSRAHPRRAVEEHRHAVAARLDRVLHEVDQRLLERFADRPAPRTARVDDETLVLAGVARGDAASSSSSRPVAALAPCAP
jgi:hypothetical protein